MKLTLQVQGDAAAALRQKNAMLLEAMHRAIVKSVILVHDRVSSSGRVPYKTGTLGRSIVMTFPPAPARFMEGQVGTNVPYAAIHEYGGKTRPHTIVPKSASVLHFFVGGREVFTRKVMHPGSVIPARPYLRPALEESQGEIEAVFEEEIAKVLD